MATQVITLDGTPTPVAGPGAVAYSAAEYGVSWFMASGLNATPPEMAHPEAGGTTIYMNVDSGENLYLIGKAGTKVTLTRQAAPE